jgi:hypothetical protein
VVLHVHECRRMAPLDGLHERSAICPSRCFGDARCLRRGFRAHTPG